MNAIEIVRELKEKGAVCLPSFFDERTAEEMRAEAMALLSARRRGRRCVHVRPKVLRGSRFPGLGQAFNSDLFKDTAVGYHPNCGAYDGFTVDHAAKAGKKITDIHFDMERSLKFMIYLSDVDKKSAAFRYSLGSHRANLRLRNRFLLLGGKLEKLPNVPSPDEQPVLTDLEGPRGTLIIFDTEGFHSAGHLEEGKQRLLIRSRQTLHGWADHKALRRAAELNPLQFFLSRLAPPGRRATGGTSRARA